MQLHKREVDPLFDRFPALETERFFLRRLTVADAPALFHMLRDDEVARFSGRPQLRRMSEAVELVRGVGLDFATRRCVRWGVSEHPQGPVLATVGLHHWDRYHRHIGIGFDVVRDRWGEGIASEAVGAVTDFALADLDVNRVEAEVMADNDACLRVLERQGFEREGLLRERMYHSGSFRDIVLLARRAGRTLPH
jgi:ribosomal-protein-alanine N-acetyltransferase